MITDLSSTLDSSAGNLTLVVIGTIQPPSTSYLGLDLTYGGPDPLHNIAGCTGFVLGFSELSGVGSLFIELGGSNGDGVHRIDLTGPGDVFYPVSSVHLNPGHTLEAFNVLHFRFEARSTEFFFTLDEIRLVPEPSAALLALAAGAGLLARRRRKA